MAALLPMMIFASCSSPGSVKDPGFALPAPPAYMAPVEKKRFKAGANAKVIAAQRNAEVDQANSRLVKSKRWYRQVRKTAGGDK
jgi:hypothetical protein